MAKPAKKKSARSKKAAGKAKSKARKKTPRQAKVKGRPAGPRVPRARTYDETTDPRWSSHVLSTSRVSPNTWERRPISAEGGPDPGVRGRDTARPDHDHGDAEGGGGGIGRDRTIRLLASPHVVAYWDAGQLFLHHVASHTTVVAQPPALHILDFYQRPGTVAELLSGVAPAHRAGFQRAIARLRQLSFLYPADRPLPGREGALQSWGEWNPAASFFHFSTRDMRWARGEVRQAMEERLARESRPADPPAGPAPSPRASGRAPPAAPVGRVRRGPPRPPHLARLRTPPARARRPGAAPSPHLRRAALGTRGDGRAAGLQDLPFRRRPQPAGGVRPGAARAGPAAGAVPLRLRVTRAGAGAARRDARSGGVVPGRAVVLPFRRGAGVDDRGGAARAPALSAGRVVRLGAAGGRPLLPDVLPGRHLAEAGAVLHGGPGQLEDRARPGRGRSERGARLRGGRGHERPRDGRHVQWPPHLPGSHLPPRSKPRATKPRSRA